MISFPTDKELPREASFAFETAGRILLWKRALDLACVFFSLPVVIPVCLAVALLILVVSGSPVFFAQRRVGFQGRRFTCYKFRTMVVNAQTLSHKQHLDKVMSGDVPTVKMDARGDHRLIPFGILLRSSGIDELPQLINVVRGDMSIVGPRPCIPYEFSKYEPWQRERTNCLPGLTGLWQVSGKNKTTFEEMIRLDIDYSRNQSFWRDAKIILMTTPALVVQMFEIYKTKNWAAVFRKDEDEPEQEDTTRPV